MLAPYKLFVSIVNYLEAQAPTPISQHLIDNANKTVRRMVDVYVQDTGYARPEFEVVFMAEFPNSLVIEPTNTTAYNICQHYFENFEPEEAL